MTNANNSFFAESKTLLLNFFADYNPEKRQQQQQFGAAVRRWRCERNLSQASFAQQLGISKAELLALEHGVISAEKLPASTKKQLRQHFR